MRKVFLFAALAASLITAAACNTVAGAGKDVSAVGNTVTDTAHDATPR